MNRKWSVFVCICLAVVAMALAGSAGAAPVSSKPAAPAVSTAGASASLPLDNYVLAGEATASIHFGCTTCNIIDACLPPHKKHDPCKPSDPRCTCEDCNGAFECFR